MFALQDIFAKINSFPQLEVITDEMNPNKGQPVPRQHDNQLVSTKCEWFFRVCKNSYSEFEDAGTVAAYDLLMEQRVEALKEQQER